MSSNMGKQPAAHKLTSEDIERLIKSPFEKKIDVTKKIALLYSNGGFTQEQMQVAEKLFRVLLKDTEVEVRKTLAEAVKDHKEMPHDVIADLARDIQEVSLPVLQFSEVLTDADLIEIIQSSEDADKQIAVSKRHKVSTSVTEALIETKNDAVVGVLLNNKGAKVSEQGYNKIVQHFSDKKHIMQTMIERETLPVTVVEHLAKTISNAIYNQLADRHKVAFEKMNEVVEQSSDVAAMKVMGLQTTEQEYYHFLELMKRLQVDDNLIPISALCMGNLNIFEVSMAHHTKVPVINVRTLMQDESNRGFRALYQRAGLPENLYQATELLMDVLRDMQNKDELQREALAISAKVSNRLIERLMMLSEERGGVDNLDYILSLVRHNAVIARK